MWAIDILMTQSDEDVEHCTETGNYKYKSICNKNSFLETLSNQYLSHSQLKFENMNSIFLLYTIFKAFLVSFL